MSKNKQFFGDFIYSKRLKLNMSLREFCKNKGYQPSYISRLENGLIKAPENLEKLKALAIALKIKEETPEWVIFFDLAAANQKSMPKSIEDRFPEIERFLPAFYRTLRKKKISKKDMEQLIQLLQETNS